MAILSRIDEMFGDPKKITRETMGPIFREMLFSFKQLKEQLESTDETKRNAALDAIAELRVKLEETAHALSASVGMDPESFAAYVKEPTHFSPEEWRAMEEANSDVADFKQELAIIAHSGDGES